MIKGLLKDKKENIFNVLDYILFEKISYRTPHKEIKEIVDSYSGDILNDGLYENYCETTQYYDDYFEKTATFLDFVSIAET